MHDYQDDTAITLEALDAALAQAAETLGAWWYVTPSPAYNAQQALAAWEAHPEGTILTNGREYGVVLQVWRMPDGWHQTAPEELETA